MKAIIVSFLVLISITGQATEATRKMPVPAEWSFITCKQLENGGMTIQKRNLQENDVVRINAPAYQVPTYEIFLNGEFVASCGYIAIK